MSNERITIFGVALAFYVVGGWSLYGGLHRHEALAHGKWPRTDAVITQAYVNDALEHGLTSEPVLGYQYIVRGIPYQVRHPSAQRVLRQAHAHASTVRVRYKPEDPAVAVLVGDPNYSTGLGLIGFGTLVALCRELVMRRRGRYRGELMPVAWQGLMQVLKKPL